MNEPLKVTVLELRRLLVELKEHRPDIGIRYRLIGKMWQQNFARIMQVTDRGVILNDETSNKLITISELSDIIQFEIDQSFQSFQPYFHYDVTMSSEWRE